MDNYYMNDEYVPHAIEAYSRKKFGDNRLSWIAGVLLFMIMIVGLAMNQVHMTGILPNGTPVSVISYTEEGAEIKLLKELKKTDYDHYIKVIYR